MNRIRPAQYPFVPGKLKGVEVSKGGALKLVDAGITTMSTSAGDQFVPFALELPTTEKYLLHVEGRNRPGANTGGDDISYFLSSVSGWTWRSGISAGNTYPVYWKLYEVPCGIVQHGRIVFTRNATGAFTQDIPLGVAINDLVNYFAIPGTLGHAITVQNIYSQIGIEGLRLVSDSILRAYLRKGNQTWTGTSYMGWQIWDPKG